MPRTSKKAVGCQKSPWVVIKGREGSHGRLVRAADIKKGLEDGRGLLQGHEGHSRHLVGAVDIKKGLEDGRSLLEGQEGRWGHFK